MEIGKPDESLGRKATGPVKWQDERHDGEGEAGKRAAQHSAAC